jgi:hypothetical protein
MLYDPQHDNRLKTQPWRQVLLDAADAIDKFGWVQGRRGDEVVGFCADGAIRYALFGKSHRSHPTGHLWNETIKAFASWCAVMYVHDYNDLWWMTKESITSALRSCARQP